MQPAWMTTELASSAVAVALLQYMVYGIREEFSEILQQVQAVSLAGMTTARQMLIGVLLMALAGMMQENPDGSNLEAKEIIIFSMMNPFMALAVINWDITLPPHASLGTVRWPSHLWEIVQGWQLSPMARPDVSWTAARVICRPLLSIRARLQEAPSSSFLAIRSWMPL